MKRLFTYFKWFFISSVGLILILYIFDVDYLLRAVKTIYLKGHTTAFLEDYKEFPNRKIKKGIAQADLYQMASYAFRRGCSDIFLLYPNITDDLNEPDIFEINSGFNINDKITITAMEIPFWTTDNLDAMALEIKLFNTLKKQLDKLIT